MRSLAPLLALAVAAPAAAQDTHLNLFIYDKSYAALGSPEVIGAPDYYELVAEPSLISEAQYAMHVALYRGMGAQALREGRGRSGFNVFLTPQFRLRARAVHSSPVSSLSFMPRFTFQWLRSTGYDGLDLREGRRYVLGLQGVIGHHSNGGATCDFVDEDPEDAVEPCRFPNDSHEFAESESREYWVDGGNFSTNFVELGVFGRVGRLHEITQDASYWRWAADLGLTGIRHHAGDFPLPGGVAPDVARIYGVNRVRLDLSGRVADLLPGMAVRAWLRLEGIGSRRHQFDGRRDYTLESELLIHGLANRHGGGAALPLLRALPNWLGIGVRYSRGQDYYNTQFVRDISYLQLVFAVEAWSPSVESGR